jgi:glutathione S-transferase
VFDAVLADAPYLAGEAPTLADWLVAPVVAAGAGLEGAERYADGLPNLEAWMARIAARPSFAATEAG